MVTLKVFCKSDGAGEQPTQLSDHLTHCPAFTIDNYEN
jgi:hypothetical protein